MTLAYPWPEGDGEVLYVIRLVFGSAMAVSIVLAIRAIRRGDFASHGAWMMRGTIIALQRVPLLPTFAYAATYVPGFLRIYSAYLGGFGVPQPPGAAQHHRRRSPISPTWGSAATARPLPRDPPS